MSLLVDWEDTIRRVVETRKNNYTTISNDERELLYLPFWYQSGNWTPCLYRCLIGSINAILLLAVDREKETNNSVNKWIGVRSDYGEFGFPASVVVHGANTDIIWHMLDCALAYWVEAALSHDRNEPELAWQPLLQAQMYIGMAAGPMSHRESSDQGRNVQHAGSRKLAAMVLTELKSFSDKQFEHSKQTFEAIASTRPIQNLQGGSEAFDDIVKTIRGLRRDDPQIMLEFDRVTALPVKPGRPPKHKSSK